MDIRDIRYRDRLEFKFLSFFLSLLMLACLVLFGVYETLLLQRAYRDLDQKGTQVAERYAEIADEWLWNLNRDQIEKSFDLEMQDPIVSGIRVLDESGGVFAQRGQLNVNGEFSFVERDIYFETDVSREYLGKVIIATTDRGLIQQVKERLLRNGILVLLIGVIAFVCAVLVNRRTIIAPLYRMISALEKTGADKYPENIDWPSKDEISIVIDTFNTIMERRRKALQKSEEMAVELQQAQKLEAVGQLAGGIAHEINTPSQYIGDNLRFLLDGEKDLIRVLTLLLKLKEASEKQEDTKTIITELDALIEEIDLDFLLEEVPLATEQSLSGIKQISNIVLAMKEFSHPGAKEKSPVDINHALKTTLTVSRNEWKNVAQIEENLDEYLGNVLCLPAEMNQVFLNLIVNAAHALEDADRGSEGKIRISTALLCDKAEIRIDDNANGIPESIQEKVFNPFFTTKDVGRGTGQGLSIARDIVVNKHGGTLEFETRQGQGTTFIITLPMH